MIKEINQSEFNKLVWDTTQFPKLIDSLLFKGNKPCVINLYTDWCMGNKYICSTLKCIALERADINIYNVNIDYNHSIAAILGINTKAIPVLIFIPMKGTPDIVHGILIKKKILEIIDNISCNM